MPISVTYTREKAIAALLNGMVEHLLEKKPRDPVSALILHLEHLHRTQPELIPRRATPDIPPAPPPEPRTGARSRGSGSAAAGESIGDNQSGEAAVVEPEPVAAAPGTGPRRGSRRGSHVDVTDGESIAASVTNSPVRDHQAAEEGRTAGGDTAGGKVGAAVEAPGTADNRATAAAGRGGDGGDGGDGSGEVLQVAAELIGNESAALRLLLATSAATPVTELGAMAAPASNSSAFANGESRTQPTPTGSKTDDPACSSTGISPQQLARAAAMSRQLVDIAEALRGTGGTATAAVAPAVVPAGLSPADGEAFRARALDQAAALDAAMALLPALTGGVAAAGCHGVAAALVAEHDAFTGLLAAAAGSGVWPQRQ